MRGSLLPEIKFKMQKSTTPVELIIHDTQQLNLKDYVDYLGPDEYEAVNFLPNSKARMRALSRGLIREHIARSLKYNPMLICFENDIFGKLKLKASDNKVWLPFFNTSYAKNRILIGISTERAIGVDIEQVQCIDYLAIARQFFHPLEILQLEEARSPIKLKNLFFRLWTYKEAFVKATGHGLSYGLDRFAVNIETGEWLDIEPAYENSELKPLLLEQLGHEYFAAQCLIY